jgi:hypothetical protein
LDGCCLLDIEEIFGTNPKIGRFNSRVGIKL